MLSPAILLAAIFSIGSVPLGGKGAHARIEAVESRVSKEKLVTVDPKSALRADLEAELSRIDWRRENVGEPFVVRAVLSEAESTAARSGSRASCTVEIVLREPSGAILGTVRGRASGEDAKGARGSLELGVLEAAAESASKAIPEAVRRSRAAR
jgi:hypothetical protein